MEVSQLIELMNAVSEAGLTDFCYEENGVSVKIKKHPEKKIVASAPVEMIAPAENQAYTYYRATIQQTEAKKRYALCKGDELNIRADKNTDSEIVGTMKKGNLCYILADETEEGVYVESGEVRGFVKKEYLQTGKKVNKKRTGGNRI